MSNQRSLRFVNAWQCMTSEQIHAVKAFWQREGALTDEAVIAQRIGEVAVCALAPSGELAAVSSAQPRLIMRLKQPMYYYRCFVGAAWRHNTLFLLRMLMQHTFDTLDAWARPRGFPCIGVILELAHPRYKETLQQAYWTNGGRPGYVFIGRSAQGHDLRVRYFVGAKLRTEAEVNAMLERAGGQVDSQASAQQPGG